ALVGPNGAGKSSLLRQLAGIDELHDGTIVRARETRFGYLAQGVADETRSNLNELVAAALAKVPDADWAFSNKRLRALLDGFGFGADEYERPLREFSGGQRSKAALAHLLIDDPEYLILDEPTNHLDIETVRWLEDYIAADKRAYVIVSHDRYFLDKVGTRVWEMDRGSLYTYAAARPAYHKYVEQRETRLAAEREAYDLFVAERDKRKASIAGLRTTLTSSNYSRVKSREKQLERVEREMSAPPPAPEVRAIGVRLQSSRRATRGFAFEVKSIAKTYNRPLFHDVTFDLQQGARLAIVGPNGAGKSTLLRILAEEMIADVGEVRYNPAARFAYFTQNAHEQLDVTASAVDAVTSGTTASEEEARNLLGRMRISGEAADKAVSAFSGGERRRIMLARLMARKCDVLLLDEPTNDLDIASREALEDVLSSYEGALVIVSHDRYLLDALSDRVLWIDDGHWGIVEGGYEGYEKAQHKRGLATAASASAAAGTSKLVRDTRLTPLKVRSKLQTIVKRIEREIEKIDARKVEIDELFADIATYNDRTKVKSLEAEREELAKRSAEQLDAWETASAELEALEV
ncbi:MAG: ABC-F family ATP-binding cassette domain-containing protein, partial [Candidatus Eremiobacteraeota bacterium]|nr:ABC-F family ATP-binding cassette domain-containing protein [Candidatus Eremiobacteraeota bacterium]